MARSPGLSGVVMMVIGVVGVLGVGAGVAAGAEELEPPRLETPRLFEFQPEAVPEIKPTAATPIYGEPGSKWWTVGGGLAVSDDSNDTNVYGSFSYFLGQDVEGMLQLGAWYFAQTGDNEAGINPAIVFRWHFFHEEPWSVFADVGVGVLLTTGPVPRGATDFGLVPRIGTGFTRRLNERGVRLEGGVRWHHISNARVRGDDENPSRDGYMFYAGVIFPF